MSTGTALALVATGLAAPLSAQASAGPVSGASSDQSSTSIVVDGTLVAIADEFQPDSPTAVPASTINDRDVFLELADGRWLPVDPASVADVASGDTVHARVVVPGVAASTSASTALDVAVAAPEPLTLVDVQATAGAQAAATFAPAVHHLTVAFVAPAGVAPDTSVTDASIRSLVSATSSYWSSQSGGAITLQTASVAGWYSSPYACSNPSSIWRETQDRLGWTPAPDDHLVLIFPTAAMDEPGCGNTGRGTIGASVDTGGYLWIADYGVGSSTLAHELGHNFSLMHADMLHCPAGTALDGDPLTTSSGCGIYSYGDFFDVMGFSGRANIGSLSTPQARRIGLLAPSGVTSLTLAGTTTVQLNAVATQSGVRSATFADPVSHERYYVELRTASGPDTGLSDYTITMTDGVSYDTAYGVRILRELPDNETTVVPLPAGSTTARRTALLAGESFTTRTGGATIHVTAQSGSTATVAITVAAPKFWDVPTGAPFQADIDWLAAQGIASGYPDWSFGPALVVTRQAMSAFLYRTAGSPAYTAPGVATFTDVPVTSPFFKQVEWLAAKGISTGSAGPNGTRVFNPGAAVSREAMAAFLYRAAGSPAFTPAATSPFVDVRTDHPFYPAIGWLASTGITTGTTTDAGVFFRPGAPVTRQAMAAFLHRYVNLTS